ncbi:MAG: DNA translocase FtsK 4TM domain-containing protein [Clostridia bacterium]|nr:DNA translocase FtsK 4TM domain-containing protein [Clostridia bacterium]
MFLVIIEGQSLWKMLHSFLFGLFGISVYLLPIFLGFVAIVSAMGKFSSAVTVKTVESSLLVLFLGAAIDIFSEHPANQGFGEHLSAAYSRGVEGGGGGFLGALIGEPINLLCGTAGAGVIVCLAIFVLFMLLTGITLIGLFKGISKPVKTAKQRASESYNRDREIREAARKKRAITDISVDDIPEERTPPEDLDEKGKKLIDAYNDNDFSKSDENEQSSFSFGDTESESELPPSISEVIDASDTENEPKSEKPVPVTESEISDFGNEVIKTGEDIPEEEEYKFPPVSLLKENLKKGSASGEKELKATAENLVNVLRSFGVETRIVDVTRGPTVTRYELQPSAGVKISKITSLADDIALNLAAAGVRIEAPIPNKAAIGIEVPNKATAMVGARDIIETVEFMTAKSKLTAALGKDISGTAILTDIAKMPHGLIAGSTGSGKSVCINSIIISLLYKATPDDVKLLMIDPKVVELGVYNGIPHLLVPVVTDPRKAAGALGWAVQEMEKRYRLFAECNVRNLEGYNHLAEMSEDLPKMPHIVIIIDELADLMATSSKEVEDYIARITAKARAAGMHLIVATQRPSVDVVTGVIKNNIPTRIAFSVSSQTDSRTIIDMGGAERLLGKGDMLYCPFGANKPIRIQGCFVSEEEVERVVDFVKNGQSSDYDEEISEEIERMAAAGNKDKSSRGDESSLGDRDPMINQAIECVIEAGRASASHLQSRLKLGYARASRIINEMEEMGIIGPYEGAKPRQVLITKSEFLEMQARSSDEE